MTWKHEAELKARLAKEIGSTVHKAGGRLKFALAYPNFYRVGMSNLGIHILYKLLNSRADTSCERFFLPEPRTLSEMERTNSPLLSLETLTPLNKFQVVGFSVSFEQDFFNVVRMLRLGKIKIRAEERTDFDPIIIAGGPCATFNPMPLSKIFDAFVIGEGEIILPPLMDLLAEEKILPREELLKKISDLPGIYVPAFPKKVRRQWLKNLDDFPAHSTILTDDTEFNMFLIETARGCGRHCRFCMAGYCFRKPRNRSLKILEAQVEAAAKFGKKIGLAGAAISDYPQINELCKFILEKNLPMSVASFRADSVTPELVRALARSGLKTLTIAPEVGSEKMRRVINKTITEENIFSAVEFGLAEGIKNFKLYFMIGLPFEELADVEAIAGLVERLKKFIDGRGGGKITLSVNPFIPKPFTPFQWSPMAEKKYLDSALKILRSRLKIFRGVEIISESLKAAEVQAILSRGDEKIAELVAESDSIKKFRELMKNFGVDENFYLRRKRLPDEKFSWDVIDMGFTKKYLLAELKRAENFQYTSPCAENCSRCGVC